MLQSVSENFAFYFISLMKKRSTLAIIHNVAGSLSQSASVCWISIPTNYTFPFSFVFFVNCFLTFVMTFSF